MGMGVSLFERIILEFPSAFVTLKSQFRMNCDIMKISNSLVYKGQLQSQSQEV